ncbi:putative membrane protein [Streptomyces himastatinicus ATCC 53653]|uniref:Putative membrane protein n=2 Tax=Streptomyces violaceusniger group TaxID=2839105 RepID=D9W960_9ACTN|nr:putative membrane protein [Streptomyces himastatinicus ATCC 53653]
MRGAGMGWTVLYIAFGVVALWLLGEVLLQYKARLRWRLLAFVGFLGVVVGVLIPSVVVIAIGAIAFAIGQTYVTLSFRQGFEKGWALESIPGVPGLGRGRERDPGPEGPEPEPMLQVSDLEDVPVSRPEPPTYRPEPMPDDTSEYGVYEEPSPFAPASGGYADPNAGYSAYETYAGYGTQDGQGVQGVPDQGYADVGYGQQQDVYADASQYGYQDQSYAAYAQDPYANAYDQQAYGQQQPYAQQQYADPYAGYQQDPYAAGGYGGDHYAADASYGSPQSYAPGADAMEPGGSWVPQQREGDTPPAQQDQPPYPYQQGGFQQGYDEQYRF